MLVGVLVAGLAMGALALRGDPWPGMLYAEEGRWFQYPGQAVYSRAPGGSPVTGSRRISGYRIMGDGERRTHVSKVGTVHLLDDAWATRSRFARGILGFFGEDGRGALYEYSNLDFIELDGAHWLVLRRKDP